MRVCVVGIGLIGGSIIKALKGAGVCTHLSVVETDEQTRALALQENLVDQAVPAIEEIAVQPDLVIIAVSISHYGPILHALRAWLQQGTIVTDVGSTKMSVIQNLRAIFDGDVPVNFVPGHPIAGRECSGFSAAQAGLFEQRRVILTPLENTAAHAMQQVTRLWQSIGADVETMDAAHHDEILALTSHLPHTLAFTLVRCLANKSDNEAIFRYAAGGFADFTRIASSNPQLWKDICLANRGALLDAMDQFIAELQIIQTALENRDGAVLESHFTAAKKARDQFCGNKEPSHKGMNK